MYKDNVVFANQELPEGITTYNFLSKMREAAGTYTITVTAKAKAGVSVNADESAKSTPARIVASVETVNAGLTWVGNVAKWTDVANATSYEVHLYKDSGVTALDTKTAISGETGVDFSTKITEGGLGTYVFKVKSLSNKSLYIDAVALSNASNKNVKLAAPTLSVVDGTYNTAQSVTITPPAGATATYYTLNGTEPNNVNGSLYSAAVSMDAAHGGSKTLKAVSYSGTQKGPVATSTYIFDKVSPSFLATSSLSYGRACTDGACGPVNDGDNIGLDFSEPMNIVSMGTLYNVVIEPSGVIKLYKGGSSKSANNLVATMTGHNNVNNNSGSDVTFNNSVGNWSNNGTHLRIILQNKNGSTNNMEGTKTVFTIEQGAIDLAGNSGAGESTTSQDSSRW